MEERARALAAGRMIAVGGDDPDGFESALGEDAMRVVDCAVGFHLEKVNSGIFVLATIELPSEIRTAFQRAGEEKQIDSVVGSHTGCLDFERPKETVRAVLCEAGANKATSERMVDETVAPTGEAPMTVLVKEVAYLPSKISPVAEAPPRTQGPTDDEIAAVFQAICSGTAQEGWARRILGG